MTKYPNLLHCAYFGLLVANLALGFCGIAGTAAPAGAQSVVPTGEIRGQIFDPTGAAVPGATIMLRNLFSGAGQATQRNSIGIYRFPAVAPEECSLAVKAAGFKMTQTTTEVRVGATAYRDFKLPVGESQESVRVVSTSVALGIAESSPSHVLDGALIGELLLNGRRSTDFTLLNPNTATDGDTNSGPGNFGTLQEVSPEQDTAHFAVLSTVHFLGSERKQR